jgi:hypothetical protein
MVFNATFVIISVILWRPVLLVEETWITRLKNRVGRVTVNTHIFFLAL